MRPSEVRSLAVLLLVAVFMTSAQPAIAGNPYKDFYVPRIPTASLRADTSIVPHSGEPSVYGGKDRHEDVFDMLENGYVMIGHSGFVGLLGNPAGAEAKARELHAAIVLMYAADPQTVTETVPVLDLSGIADVLNPKKETTRTSGTVYGSGGSASYSETSTKTVPRERSGPRTVTQTSTVYDQLATYWVKAKPRGLGVFLKDLSAAQRAARGSNKGAVVVAVVKGGPAFMADVMRGDILLKIGDVQIAQFDDVSTAVERYSGKETDLVVVRGTEEKTLPIRMNSR